MSDDATNRSLMDITSRLGVLQGTVEGVRERVDRLDISNNEQFTDLHKRMSIHKADNERLVRSEANRLSEESGGRAALNATEHEKMKGDIASLKTTETRVGTVWLTISTICLGLASIAGLVIEAIHYTH